MSTMDQGGHIFEGERCIFCRTNVYDIGIYPDAPEICPVQREPIRYTTETPSPDQESETTFALEDGFRRHCPSTDHDGVEVPVSRRIDAIANSVAHHVNQPEPFKLALCDYCAEGRAASLLRLGFRITIWAVDL